MTKQIALFDPIPLPDRRRPETMPSLPAWLERSSAGVKLELQPTETGSFQDVETLPAALIPTAEQREAMAAHIVSLRSYLAETAANSIDAETQIASAVTSLLLVLPSARKSELGAEARADVYLDVLDDVPWWAVKAACKRWHKRDCGTDENGKPYDYRWAPDPGTLRRVAFGETWAAKDRIRKLERVLLAREYVDCTAQLEAGRAAMRGLNIRMQQGRVNDPLSFAEAVELGVGVGGEQQQAAE